MKITHFKKLALSPDPIGDALADCYTFLLRKLDLEKTRTMKQPSDSQPEQPEGLLIRENPGD